MNSSEVISQLDLIFISEVFSFSNFDNFLLNTSLFFLLYSTLSV